MMSYIDGNDFICNKNFKVRQVGPQGALHFWLNPPSPVINCGLSL